MRVNYCHESDCDNQHLWIKEVVVNIIKTTERINKVNGWLSHKET